PTPEEYAQAVSKVFAGLDVRLILEPGRFLVGNAGALLTRVIYNKTGETKNFVIVDGASNDLMRPALYGAYHRILPARENKGTPIKVDVVGPICETGDFLAQDRELPAVAPGDLLAVLSAGAYGFSMSSTYNSRPRAAEVMVSGTKAEIIRERETDEDLVRGEKVPKFV
ncbi:MAG: diaminopimelate decarboxylase, partial [Deltaproteobacteria bacterium]|nr:diaminopimelate decarboxylase [Deltaproteobacteria bacterium]